MPRAASLGAMNFEPTEDQAMVKALVERCVAAAGDLPARAAGRLEARGFSAANWARLAAAGVLALPVSAARGGMGEDRAALLLAMEALGRGLTAEPVLEVAVIGAGLLDIAGDAAQQAAVIAAVTAGQALVTLAHVERGARFEMAHVATVATGDVLSGTKTAVAAGAAEWLIVSARAEGGVRDPAGIGLWLVRADAPGVDRRLYRLADGSWAAEIVMREVTGERLAGRFEALQRVAALGRAAAAAEMLGLMQLLFDATLAHVKTRVQFGRPLGDFQVIQHRMVEAYARVEQARSWVTRAMLASDVEFARVAAGAKAFVAEAALAVAHEAVQLHGGMGITDELVIGHALKRIRVLALVFGDAAAAVDDYRVAA